MPGQPPIKATPPPGAIKYEGNVSIELIEPVRKERYRRLLTGYPIVFPKFTPPLDNTEIEYFIMQNGDVDGYSVRKMRGSVDTEFDDAALRAVRSWVYSSIGRPINERVTIRVEWSQRIIYVKLPPTSESGRTAANQVYAPDFKVLHM
jgi:hypothetical protein